MNDVPSRTSRSDLIALALGVLLGGAIPTLATVPALLDTQSAVSRFCEQRECGTLAEFNIVGGGWIALSLLIVPALIAAFSLFVMRRSLFEEQRLSNAIWAGCAMILMGGLSYLLANYGGWTQRINVDHWCMNMACPEPGIGAMLNYAYDNMIAGSFAVMVSGIVLLVGGIVMIVLRRRAT